MKKIIKTKKYNFRVDYYADENGHIWSETKRDYLKERTDKDGYLKVMLMTTDKPKGKGHYFSVHRLILSTFSPREDMDYLTVDHINGDKTDNNLINLRWATIKENLNNPNTKDNCKCYKQDGVNNSNATLTLEKLYSLIKDVNSGSFKRKEILLKYDICSETLRKILLKDSYKKELSDIEIKPIFIEDMARDTKGEKNGRAKLNEKQVLEIIDLLLSKKYSLSQIAARYNVTTNAIFKIKSKNTWTYLTKNINFS